MTGFLKFLVDVLSVPAILVGISAMVGLIALKKPFTEVLTGTFKAIIGFLILGAGAGFLVSSLNGLSPLLEAGFGIRGVIPNNEAVVAIATQTLGRETALIMVLGFVVNLVLARFTPLKYIWLTGHHSFYMAAMLAAVLGASRLSGTAVIIVGALLLGLIQVLMPAWAQGTMRKITGGDDVALGHFGTLGYVVSAWVGKLVGDSSKSTEDLKMPKSLGFLRDSLVATAIIMIIIFFIAVIAAGPAFTENQSGGQNFIVYAFIQGLSFTAGVAIILQGVRMILAEIVPAFKGIAEKVVPDAKPALDCPITFPFAPNAVIIGFLASFVGGIIGMIVLGFTSLTVIVPGLVPHFFVGGTAGVFGNATGGRRGAIIGAFVNGLIITFLAALLLPVLGDLGFANTTFGDADFQWLGILVGNLAKLLK
ncbi:MAG: PTS ascorbate transporter subunit IIC [Chloroflexi bacterium HGW-Chloroflexi-3]|nr:MAG: PTS ascorbate transporter subunit IIC [Chloroflexi bacterium HGW-Chloroflexi-3]